MCLADLYETLGRFLKDLGLLSQVTAAGSRRQSQGGFFLFALLSLQELVQLLFAVLIRWQSLHFSTFHSFQLALNIFPPRLWYLCRGHQKFEKRLWIQITPEQLSPFTSWQVCTCSGRSLATQSNCTNRHWKSLKMPMAQTTRILLVNLRHLPLCTRNKISKIEITNTLVLWWGVTVLNILMWQALFCGSVPFLILYLFNASCSNTICWSASSWGKQKLELEDPSLSEDEQRIEHGVWSHIAGLESGLPHWLAL